jgi:hypothetical protein
MFKKFGMLLACAFLLLNVSGCFALFAGAAGGAGTAVWLSGKLTQEVNLSVERSQKAAKSALTSLSLDIAKETVKEDIVQLISRYTDGRTIWVDIHRITDKVSRIEVRVGAAGDKEAARKIMERISKYL